MVGRVDAVCWPRAPWDLPWGSPASTTAGGPSGDAPRPRAGFPWPGRDPEWETWTGVNGMLYAWRKNSSPAIVLRAASPVAMAVAVTRAEGELL